jgi:hypothetical protein
VPRTRPPYPSEYTSTALRRRAFFPDPRPIGLHPPGDRLLVAFHRAAGGALQAPAQPAAQQLPHVPGMVGNPGRLLDHVRDAGQGPVVGVEPVRTGAFTQRPLEIVQLLVGQARGVPGGAGAGAAWSCAAPPARPRAIGRASGWRSAGRHPVRGRPRLGSGQRRTARRPTCGRVRRLGGRVDRGRCGGRRLVSSRHAARTPPIMSSEGANLFNGSRQTRVRRSLAGR